MSSDLIPIAELDEIRHIGDPTIPAQEDLGDTFKKTQDKSFLGFRPGWPSQDVSDFPTEIEIDKEKLALACDLFSRYGTEIAGALLMAALPHAYAAQWGSRVLTATARLQTDFRRRIVRTSQFVLMVTRAPQGDETFEHLWRPDKAGLRSAFRPEQMPPWRACLVVRQFHESVRREIAADKRLQESVGPENATPLNQEDLLATLLSFTITVFEVLERYGITWTADQQEAYMHLWDLVGEWLGIGTADVRPKLPQVLSRKVEDEQWIGLRPPTIAETRRLFDQLRKRQWREPEAIAPLPETNGSEKTDCEPGRVLVRALLNELAVGMPRGTRGLPLTVMRQLAPPVVRDRLSLGGGGIVMSLLDQLPKRRVLGERFTASSAPNRLSGAVVRSMANEVTRRAILRFIRTEHLFIPGLNVWSEGLRDPMEVGIA